MAYSWGADNPNRPPTPPDLRSHPIPAGELLAAIHNPPSRTPPTERPTAPQPNEHTAA